MLATRPGRTPRWKDAVQGQQVLHGASKELHMLRHVLLRHVVLKECLLKECVFYRNPERLLLGVMHGLLVPSSSRSLQVKQVRFVCRLFGQFPCRSLGSQWTF